MRANIEERETVWNIGRRYKMLHQFVTQVYTGPGKCKTTAALGLALRAMGAEWKVGIFQFLKGDNSINYGELIASKRFTDLLTIYQSHNTPKIVLECNKTKEDERLVNDLWDKMEGVLFDPATYQWTEQFDMIIMDEILPTLCMKLITQKKFFEFHDRMQGKAEIVYTGRIWDETIYDRIKNISDLMTDGRCIKHYLNKHCPACKREFEYRSNYCPNCGRELITVPARPGIEY